MPSPERKIHDFIIIGGGPAGLSAAITAESERVETMVLDGGTQIGGQAGTTSLIENYPGFPQGVTGIGLMSQIVDQALKFNTEFNGPARATSIERTDDDILLIHTDDREKYFGKYVLLSTGVETRLLNARNMAAYMGRGVTYGPPSNNGDYRDKTVVVVGGGNSAGQAAFKLSEFSACNVNLLIRGENIEKSMSGYLIDKIKTKDNITVHTNTELVGVDGNGHLEKVTLKDDSDALSQLQAQEVFVFIGSLPKTQWLPTSIHLDDHGFVLVGSELPDEARAAFMEQTKGRKPFSHETSLPGVFVAGDVRSGTNKRVASAVGDGVAVVPEIHNLRVFKPERSQ